MDDDTLPLIAMGSMFALFLSFPFMAIAIATSCIAYSRTKEWEKKRTLEAANTESEGINLLDSDEDDFLDTDDEADYNERKAEEEADKFLTFNQKWRKEFRTVWKGRGKEQIKKDKEREERKERRKLAKAVAQELERRERRRANKAAREEVGAEDTLPPYRKN